jgi:hypothetical protein
MKVIFSRKGFDSRAGGFASPIFPDGTIFSVPIPAKNNNTSYSDLSFQYNGESISTILNQITKSKKGAGHSRIFSEEMQYCDYQDSNNKMHHDPMLFNEETLKGLVFGQAGSAAGELINQKVKEDDIFLFYGWFREVEKDGVGEWKYKQDSKDKQVIWSWLQVQNCVDLNNANDRDDIIKRYPFITKHPHFFDRYGIKNLLYIPTDHNLFISRGTGRASSGVFEKYDAKRCLTDLHNYKGRSTWRLPLCFQYPHAFTRLKNFTPEGRDTVVFYKGFGQEYILDLDKVDILDRENILKYVENIF